MDDFIYSEFEVLDLISLLHKNEDSIKLPNLPTVIFNLRNFGREIIDHLAKFEKILLKVWEKPKFIISTHYCISLNSLPPFLLSKILSNSAQLKWWKDNLNFDLDIFAVEECGFHPLANSNKQTPKEERNDLNNYLESNPEKISHLYQQLISYYPGLMIDTKFYSEEIQCEILENIENLDGKLTGILFNSDNFHALRLLSATFQDRIDLCYIDPPYNTGNETLTYHDELSHGTWLSMMQVGMENLYPLLSERGIMVTSLDDHEYHYFRLLGEKNFGAKNFLGNIVWHSTKSITNTALISQAHTHNLIFAKNLSYFRTNRTEFRLPETGKGFSNPDNDPKGPWKADPFMVGGWRPNQQYKIKNPKTGEDFVPNLGCSWKNDKKTFDRLWKEGRIVFGKSGEGGPQRKRYLSEALSRGRVTNTIWTDVPTTTHATKELKNMFNKIVFSNSKPVELLKRFIELGSSNNSWIIDFFAGSGTTGQAVIELNQAGSSLTEPSQRKFILIEKEEIFHTVLLPRLMKACFAKEWKQGKPKFPNTSSVSNALNEPKVPKVPKVPNVLNEPNSPKVSNNPLIFRYHEVEQFEDSWENISLDEISENFETTFNISFSPAFLYPFEISNPWRYALQTINSQGIFPKNVDLIHTYCFLSGLQILLYQNLNFLDSSIFPVHSVGRDMLILTAYNQKRVLLIWREIPQNLHLQEVIEEEIKEKSILSQTLSHFQVDEVFINGPLLFENIPQLDEKFRKFFLQNSKI